MVVSKPAGGAPGSAPVALSPTAYWTPDPARRRARRKALDTAVLAGGLPAGFDTTICRTAPIRNSSTSARRTPIPGSPVLPPTNPVPVPVPVPVSLPQSSLLLLANNNPINPPAPPPDLLNMQLLNQQAQQQQQQQQGPAAPAVASINNPTRLDVGAGRYFYLPPPEETRLVQDEVVIQLPCNTPQQTLNDTADAPAVLRVGSQCLTSINTAIHRLHIEGRQSIANAIRSLASNRIIVAGQANYIYTLGQDLAGDRMQGDSGQYVLDKLKMGDILRRVRANNIPVAVIDSEIDASHPDLEGTVMTVST